MRHFLDGEVASFDFALPRSSVEVHAALDQFADQRSELRSADYWLVPGKDAGECRMRLPAVQDVLEVRRFTA